MQNLIDKLKAQEAVIYIVGMGYVGLPLALRFTEVGYKVVGLDIDKSKVDLLNQGKSYIEHIPSSDVALAQKSGLEATTDFSRAGEADALILCVPTPLNKYREPDISYVIDTTEALLPYLREGQVLSLESTTYPGTTVEELQPRIESQGLLVGKDFALVYSPEREDPGNPDFTTKDIPKVCGGVSPSCKDVGMALYGHVVNKVVPVSSTQAAEMTKLLENIHRAVNIGLVNELKIVSDKMGIDIYEVINAAATKPFGFTAYYPGPGLGGHCIPIDPFYLTWKAREFDVHTRFIELAGEVNDAMPDYVVQKIGHGLNQNKKSINGSKILILGIAYKKNVDDMRESPSVIIMEKLEALGAEISYSDPHVEEFPKMREHDFDLKSVDLSSESLKGFDCVVLATDHARFDYDLLLKESKLLIDTRGKFDPQASNVIRA